MGIQRLAVLTIGLAVLVSLAPEGRSGSRSVGPFDCFSSALGAKPDEQVAALPVGKTLCGSIIDSGKTVLLGLKGLENGDRIAVKSLGKGRLEVKSLVPGKPMSILVDVMDFMAPTPALLSLGLEPVSARRLASGQKIATRVGSPAVLARTGLKGARAGQKIEVENLGQRRWKIKSLAKAGGGEVVVGTLDLWRPKSPLAKLMVNTDLAPKTALASLPRGTLLLVEVTNPAPFAEVGLKGAARGLNVFVEMLAGGKAKITTLSPGFALSIRPPDLDCLESEGAARLKLISIPRGARVKATAADPVRAAKAGLAGLGKNSEVDVINLDDSKVRVQKVGAATPLKIDVEIGNFY